MRQDLRNRIELVAKALEKIGDIATLDQLNESAGLEAQPTSYPSVQLFCHLIGSFRGIGISAQSAHWLASGVGSLADHELFEKVYSTLFELMDDMAEHAVDLPGSVAHLLPLQHAEYAKQVTSDASADVIGQGGSASTILVQHLGTALQEIDRVRDGLETDEILTSGLRNLLEDTATKVEKLVYLLTRRSTSFAPSGA